MAKKNIMTRSASNFFYPNKYIKSKDELASEGGWIKPKRFRNKRLGTLYSPKILAFILNVIMHKNQKHVLFTFFKRKSGVELLHSLFSMCGVKSAIFSGDLDDKQREKVLKQFNSEQNRYGKKISVLLVTEAGAEGISIMESRHMHILESGPRESKILQAIGRIARYKSHFKMPKSQQNVKIWRYWSMASPETLDTKKTIDEILYNKGQKTMRTIDSFHELLQEVSVTYYKKNESYEEKSNK